MKGILFIIFFVVLPVWYFYPDLQKNDVKQLSLRFLKTSDKLESFIDENISCKNFGKAKDVQSEKFSFPSGNFNFSKSVDYAKKITSFEIISNTHLVRIYWTKSEHETSGYIYLGPKEEMMLYLTKVTDKWFFTKNQEDRIFKPDNFSDYEKVFADLHQLYRSYKNTPKIKPGK